MPKLSIIVPIYNVEKYLARCIESLLEQTYRDYELILINDGSPDNCPEIMELYAKKDERVVLIHKENGGVSSARNAGLKKAQGKYIGFVDPDDYVESTFFQELIEELEKTNAQIACCNWDSFYEHGEVKVHPVENVGFYMSQKEFTKHLFDSPRTLAGSNCNKLFLKEYIDAYYDEKLSICEDNLFLLQYCKHIKKACYINKALYHIMERSDSAMRKNNGRIVYGLSVRKNLIEIARSIHHEIGKLAEKDYLDFCYLYMNQFRNEDEYYQIARNAFINYMRENIFNVLLNEEIYWKNRIMYFLKAFI